MIVSENFLLTCSDTTLDNFELAILEREAQLRAEMHELEERLTETRSRATVVRWFRWFRVQDWEALKHTPENQETAEAWAARMIRECQRSKEELIPRPSLLPPGAAHLAAAKRDQESNIAEGKCRYCPEPICRESVDMCTEHLAKSRARAQQKEALSVPGSTAYLRRRDYAISPARNDAGRRGKRGMTRWEYLRLWDQGEQKGPPFRVAGGPGVCRTGRLLHYGTAALNQAQRTESPLGSDWSMGRNEK